MNYVCGCCGYVYEPEIGLQKMDLNLVHNLKIFQTRIGIALYVDRLRMISHHWMIR